MSSQVENLIRQAQGQGGTLKQAFSLVCSMLKTEAGARTHITETEINNAQEAAQSLQAQINTIVTDANNYGGGLSAQDRKNIYTLRKQLQVQMRIIRTGEIGLENGRIGLSYVAEGTPKQVDADIQNKIESEKYGDYIRMG